jgi:hypothetical protein
MALGKLGGALRPRSFRDPDNAAKRGKVWVCGVLLLLLVLGAILWYHSENQSYTQKRVHDPTVAKVKALYAREAAEDISGLECKCASKLVEYYPPLLDLTGDGCGGDNGVDGTEEGDVFTARIYERCVQNFALGVADAGVGTVSPRTCADPEATGNFYENMCVTFVSGLQSEWDMKKEKVSKVRSNEFYVDDVLEDYYDACIVALTKQTGFVEMLYASLRHFGVDAVTRDHFDEDIREPFVNTLAAYDEKICIYPADSDLYTDLRARELSSLDAAYEEHFGGCEPSACTYDQLETALDTLLKTIALASPLMALIMSIAAFAYNSMEKDNWSDVQKTTTKKSQVAPSEYSGATLKMTERMDHIQNDSFEENTKMKTQILQGS